MSLFKRGKIWWYEFWFAGRRIQESAKTASKTVAKRAEQQRRRELEEGLTASKTAAKSESERFERSQRNTSKATFCEIAVWRLRSTP
jgi:hypothetical protein